MIEPNERTYTASLSADTAFETWIRTESGPADLDGAGIEVSVLPYSGPHIRQVISAAGDDKGIVSWGVTAEQARKLGPGLYRIIIRRTDRGELLHRGTLEVSA